MSGIDPQTFGLALIAVGALTLAFALGALATLLSNRRRR